MVEGTGLENRRPLMWTASSNLAPSAKRSLFYPPSPRLRRVAPDEACGGCHRRKPVRLDRLTDIGENDSQGGFPVPVTLYEKLGGETQLRRIIDTFIDRVFSDRMIGFFFRNADKARIKEMEFQLTAKFLGADIEYQGRPLDEVHSKHPIMGGQFMRRLQILRETLDSYNVPEEVREAWLSHTESLRPLITRDAGSDCDPDLARKKVIG